MKLSPWAKFKYRQRVSHEEAMNQPEAKLASEIADVVDELLDGNVRWKCPHCGLTTRTGLHGNLCAACGRYDDEPEGTDASVRPGIEI